MQRDFHLFPESEGELRRSLEHSNPTCGLSASLLGQDRSTERPTSPSRLPGPAASVSHSSFRVITVIPPPRQFSKQLLAWFPFLSFSPHAGMHFHEKGYLAIL